jgi:abortive infection bacteriophage resistance protein
MKFSKPPLSQQKLIDLMSQRGLPLSSPGELDVARRALDRVGYFRLSGFMLPFVHGGGGGNRHNFKSDASIEKIVSLHDFDASMRMHCIEGLSQIEVSVRASICDHLSRSYGSHWPLSSKPFKAGKHTDNLSALADAVKFDFNRGQPYPRRDDGHQFLDRYYAKYTDPATRMPPGWMIRECVSFRTWAFLYEGLEAAEQKQISDAWKFSSGKRIDHTILEDWFHSLSILRNRCAHHGRITHKTFPFAPTAPRDPSVADLFREQGADLRTLMVVIAVLLKCVDPRSIWTRKLYTFLEWQSTVDIGAAAGFTPWNLGTWRDDPLWSV